MTVGVLQQSAGHLMALEPVPTTSLGFAIVFCLLTTAALTASSLHMWGCYALGRQIAGRGAPSLWQTAGFGAFLLLFGVSWLEGQVMNQVNLRRLSFLEMFRESSGRRLR